MKVTCNCGTPFCSADTIHEFPAPRASTPIPEDTTGGDRAGTLGHQLAAEGQRMADYGHPAVAFARIAGLWSEYLNKTVTAYDVAYMMILLKVSRLATAPAHSDSWTDIEGYISCARQVHERRTTP